MASPIGIEPTTYCLGGLRNKIQNSKKYLKLFKNQQNTFNFLFVNFCILVSILINFATISPLLKLLSFPKLFAF